MGLFKASTETRLRRLEQRQAQLRTRYLAVERPEDVPERIEAAPGEQVFVIVTGVPRVPVGRDE